MLLPKCLPDELLLSRMIRYITISGDDVTELLRMIFGSDRSSIHPFLTSGLKQIAKASGETAGDLLIQQTLAPLFFFFVPLHADQLKRFLLVNQAARMSCLNAAIDAVIHDYIFFPSKDLLLVSSDNVAFNKNQRESIDCLTGREKDVLYKVLQDKSLTQVAEELGVSIKTISTYKSRIFKKLDVTNLVELSLLLNRILRRNSERAEHGLSVSSD